jgi:hypothetical protein
MHRMPLATVCRASRATRTPPSGPHVGAAAMAPATVSAPVRSARTASAACCCTASTARDASVACSCASAAAKRCEAESGRRWRLLIGGVAAMPLLGTGTLMTSPSRVEARRQMLPAQVTLATSRMACAEESTGSHAGSGNVASSGDDSNTPVSHATATRVVCGTTQAPVTAAHGTERSSMWREALPTSRAMTTRPASPTRSSASCASTAMWTHGWCRWNNTTGRPHPPAWPDELQV